MTRSYSELMIDKCYLNITSIYTCFRNYHNHHMNIPANMVYKNNKIFCVRHGRFGFEICWL